MISDLELEKEMGFQLQSLIAKDGDISVYDINFLRNDFRHAKNVPITTLLVGANGTGKSTILQIITEIIYAVECQAKSKAQISSKKYKYNYYELSYKLNGQLVKIIISKNKIEMFCNKSKLNVDEYLSHLPNKSLALAFMMNDKYIYSNSENDSKYEYLGIRETSNAVFLNYMPSRVIENLVYLEKKDSIDKFIRELSIILGQELSFSVAIMYKYRILTIDDTFENHLRERVDRLRSRGSFRTDLIKKITDDDIKNCSDFIRKTKGLINGTERKKELEFSFDTGTIKLYIENYQNIRYLKALGVIDKEILYITQKKNKYSFLDASSGQKNMIYVSSMISRYIQDNSLILIDEPEVSLHPNWQMMYVSFIKKMFSDYPTSHFVIATHSPYFVSDLEKEASSVVALKRDNDNVICDTLQYDTYAWSVDNILYEVFGARTTRNYYFEMDLRKLISIVSDENTRDTKEVKRLYKKLSGYVFSESDPLNKILEQVGEIEKNAKAE